MNITSKYTYIKPNLNDSVHTHTYIQDTHTHIYSVVTTWLTLPGALDGVQINLYREPMEVFVADRMPFLVPNPRH